MQKLSLKHTLTHRLSPQKLQLIKLLQVPAAAMKTRVEQEIAKNPALEEVNDTIEVHEEDEGNADEILLEQLHMQSHETPLLYNRRQEQEDWLTTKALLLSTTPSLDEQLLRQLSFLQLDDRLHKIGVHLIGSIEHDGYIRRDLETIVNDLAFTQYIETNVQEVESVLKAIQSFDPPGVASRNLQECLLIQLKKHNDDRTASKLAIRILTECFDAFAKKHYNKIAVHLGIADAALFKEALTLITRLDPKPGSSINTPVRNEVVQPDFFVTKQKGQLHVALITYTTPTLRTKKSYVAMLQQHNANKKKDARSQEAASFLKKRLEAAQWFIDAIKQRQATLLATMQAIVSLQQPFFLEEEESRLKPMVLKCVAAEIGMDVSTVARIVSNKTVQTDFAIYPLKFFFTESITTASGEAVSNRAIKQAVAQIIQNEDKKKPYSDEKIGTLLKSQGYPIARRTVAKYREQLRLPVARLRKAI